MKIVRKNGCVFVVLTFWPLYMIFVWFWSVTILNVSCFSSLRTFILALNPNLSTGWLNNPYRELKINTYIYPEQILLWRLDYRYIFTLFSFQNYHCFDAILFNSGHASTVKLQIFFHINIFFVKCIHLWQNGETVHFQGSSSWLMYLYCCMFFHLLFSHTCSFILWSNTASVSSNCIFSTNAFISR